MMELKCKQLTIASQERFLEKNTSLNLLFKQATYFVQKR